MGCGVEMIDVLSCHCVRLKRMISSILLNGGYPFALLTWKMGSRADEGLSGRCPKRLLGVRTAVRAM